MEPESVSILMNLLNLSPVVAILVWVVYYFRGEVSMKNTEIKELNQALRDTQKETILAINKLTDVVQDLRDVIKEKLK